MQRHRFDLFSFVFGVIFLAIAAFAVFRESLDTDLQAWIWPTALIVLGLGLFSSALRGKR